MFYSAVLETFCFFIFIFNLLGHENASRRHMLNDNELDQHEKQKIVITIQTERQLGMEAPEEDDLMEDVLAWQSTTNQNYSAEKAVDKNNKSCAKTKSTPTFFVYIHPHIIRKIKIWTSHEEENEKNDKFYSVCLSMRHIIKHLAECEKKAPNRTDARGGMFVEFSKEGTKHKHEFIRVELLKMQYITDIRINEIKIYGLKDFRVGKEEYLINDMKVSQSSTYGDHIAMNAIDDDFNTFSQTDSQPVFRLELKKEHEIRTIKIWTNQLFKEDGWLYWVSLKKEIESSQSYLCHDGSKVLTDSMYLEKKFCDGSDKYRYVFVSSWTDLCICELEVLSTRDQDFSMPFWVWILSTIAFISIICLIGVICTIRHCVKNDEVNGESLKTLSVKPSFLDAAFVEVENEKKKKKKKNVEKKVANKNSENLKNVGTKKDGLRSSKKSIKPSVEKKSKLDFHRNGMGTTSIKKETSRGKSNDKTGSKTHKKPLDEISNLRSKENNTEAKKSELNGKMINIEEKDRKKSATNVDVKIDNNIVRPRKSFDEKITKTENEATNKKVTKLGERIVEKLENSKKYRSKKIFNKRVNKPYLKKNRKNTKKIEKKSVDNKRSKNIDRPRKPFDKKLTKSEIEQIRKIATLMEKKNNDKNENKKRNTLRKSFDEKTTKNKSEKKKESTNIDVKNIDRAKIGTNNKTMKPLKKKLTTDYENVEKLKGKTEIDKKKADEGKTETSSESDEPFAKKMTDYGIEKKQKDEATKILGENIENKKNKKIEKPSAEKMIENKQTKESTENEMKKVNNKNEIKLNPMQLFARKISEYKNKLKKQWATKSEEKMVDNKRNIYMYRPRKLFNKKGVNYESEKKTKAAAGIEQKNNDRNKSLKYYRPRKPLDKKITKPGSEEIKKEATKVEEIKKEATKVEEMVDNNKNETLQSQKSNSQEND